ncbi:MAG: uroporphyrinogen decarboxylase family protein, partial [Planctomycetes bacterium]|nr:uroporphyrinogen decarboxylase family protein [Planctomycetota bacterium]
MRRKSRQNARECWRLLLIDEPPGRPIAFPLVTSRAAAAGGVSVGRYCADAGAMAASHLAALEAFGVDGASLFTDVGIVAEALGSEFTHPEDDIPSLSRPALGEGRTARDLPVPGEGSGRFPVVAKAAALVHDAVGDTVPVFAYVPGPFTTAAMLRGTEEFLTDLVVAPDLARGVLRAAAGAAIPFADALIKAGALPVVVEPLASGSVISPDAFRTFAQPFLRSLIGYLHRFDLDVTLHVCGDTAAMLGLLADTGADLLSLDRADLGEAAAEVGSRCRLVGNVPTEVLLYGTPAEVGAAVEAAVKAGRGTPKGFVASTGCEVPHAAPAENVRAFVEAVRG